LFDLRPAPSKDSLVIDLNKWGFEVMDQLLPTTLDTHLLEVEHSFSLSDESSPLSYLLTFKQAFRSGLQQGPKNEEESDAETFGCKDSLVHDNNMISSSLPPTPLQLIESLMALEVPPTALQLLLLAVQGEKEA
jgi:hypothetical protein